MTATKVEVLANPEFGDTGGAILAVDDMTLSAGTLLTLNNMQQAVSNTRCEHGARQAQQQLLLQHRLAFLQVLLDHTLQRLIFTSAHPVHPPESRVLLSLTPALPPLPLPPFIPPLHSPFLHTFIFPFRQERETS